MVHVHIGPLPSGGVLSWLGYARSILVQLQEHTGPAEPAVDEAALEAFEGFLVEWESVARRSPEFVWESEIDREQAEFLAHAFLSVARALAEAAERRGYPVGPAEGEPFYQSLVTSFLDALEQESHGSASFAEDVRESWPGLEER